jgi:3-keto-5-aminohexanoate cleavage enzyme
MDKVIITCAVTGAETTKNQCPNLPVTPKEIADSAYECYLAGASIIHLHVRNDDGTPTSNLNVFKEAIDLIRKKCDIVIEITTGGAVGMSPNERILPVSLKPDMASLDCGTVNFGNDYIINTLPVMKMFASEMNKYNVKPTFECFDISHIISSHTLIKEGLVKPPYHYGFVLNVPAALPYTHKTLSNMIDLLPNDSEWTVMGIGKAHLPAIFGALSFGGNIRVGYEDNIYYSKGVVAKSNAEFVERAATLVKIAQKEVASPDDVRDFFKIK